MDESVVRSFEGRRVGLVLCGGGAMGAYQIGVWKALLELGVNKFDVIAGTSVGALNAALVAGSEIASAERVWREIEVLKWELRHVGALVLGYALVLGPLLVSFSATTLAVLAVLLFGPNHPGVNLWGVAAFAALASWTIAGLSRISEQKPFFLLDAETFYFLSVLALIISLFLVALAGFAATFIHGVQQNPPSAVSPLTFALVLLPIPVGVLLALVGFPILRFAQRNSSLFSSTGVVNAIKETFDMDRMRDRVRAVFVTVARSRVHLDPFVLNIRRSSEGGPGNAHAQTDFETPRFSDIWVADYIDLSEAQTLDGAIETLRLSGALPWVFRSGLSSGSLAIDGGLADNTPILPVLLAGVDILIVVPLDPLPNASRSGLQAGVNHAWNWHCAQRLTDAEIVDLYRARVLFKESPIIPSAPSLSDIEIYVLSPQQPLATWPRFSFATGVMNFSLVAIEAWMRRGYEETHAHFWARRLA